MLWGETKSLMHVWVCEQSKPGMRATRNGQDTSLCKFSLHAIRQWPTPGLHTYRTETLMCGRCSYLPKGENLGGLRLLCAARCPLIGSGNEMGTRSWHEILTHMVATKSKYLVGLKETALSQASQICLHASPFAVCCPVCWVGSVSLWASAFIVCACLSHYINRMGL